MTSLTCVNRVHWTTTHLKSWSRKNRFNQERRREMAEKTKGVMTVRSGENELRFVKQFHDEAYRFTEQALSQEECGHGQQALDLYEKSLQQLQQGLSIACDGPLCTGEKWDLARMTQMKMRKTKDQVMSRLEHLAQERGANASAAVVLPSYEEACVENGNRPVKTYGELRGMLEPKDVDDLPAYSEESTDVSEMFSIPHGAQIFFVSSDGSVSAPSYPTALHVFKFVRHDEIKSDQPEAFLQVGEWIYPLHPGHLPVLHASYGAYLFPDPNSPENGAAIGLLLSDEIPAEVRHRFERIMYDLTAIRHETPERRLSTRLSEGIVSGAEMLSRGVVVGAEMTSNLVQIGARKLRERLSPNEQTAAVDPRLQKGLEVARDVSGVAVQVSGFLVSQLGRGTRALGQYLAPYVRTHGSRLLSKAMGSDDDDVDGRRKADETIDGVLEVAAGGLQGFSTVYLGLETAAKMLAKNLVAETVTTVQHRYGPEASTSTDTALHAVGNLAFTAYNVNNLGLRAVAKQTAKDTGKALVQQSKQPKS